MKYYKWYGTIVRAGAPEDKVFRFWVHLPPNDQCGRMNSVLVRTQYKY